MYFEFMNNLFCCMASKHKAIRHCMQQYQKLLLVLRSQFQQYLINLSISLSSGKTLKYPILIGIARILYLLKSHPRHPRDLMFMHAYLPNGLPTLPSLQITSLQHRALGKYRITCLSAVGSDADDVNCMLVHAPPRGLTPAFLSPQLLLLPCAQPLM